MLEPWKRLLEAIKTKRMVAKTINQGIFKVKGTPGKLEQITVNYDPTFNARSGLSLGKVQIIRQFTFLGTSKRRSASITVK